MSSIGRSVSHELGVRSAIGRFDSPACICGISNCISLFENDKMTSAGCWQVLSSITISNNLHPDGNTTMSLVKCTCTITNFGCLWVLQATRLPWITHFIHPLHWRHNGRDSVSNHQPHDCLLNRLFRRRSKHQSSASLAFVRGIHRWPVNSFAQMASKAENVFILWRHHALQQLWKTFLQVILHHVKQWVWWWKSRIWGVEYKFYGFPHDLNEIDKCVTNFT